MVVQSALGGMRPSGAGVQASTAARAEAPEEPAWLRSRQTAQHPQGEGVLPGPTQQGVRLPVAQPQAGGVWDQM